jgi:putative PIG3 family NAD(P)H quinone oxidoreductase
MPLPQTMSAVTVPAPGGPEVLTPAELPLPEPGPGEVLIRVAAAGVNAPDLAQRAGHYPPPPGASPLLGLEVAGEIAVAAGNWRVGDRVAALANGGGYAEYAAVPAGQVLPVPAGWDMVDAAALPETWFTVTQGLVMRAGLEPGMSVLVTGAAGGIGGAAIQICRILGAEPIALVSSDEKAAYVRGLGASAVIRHDREDVVARARELTGGKGVDRVLDMVGGPATARHVEALAPFGHLVLVATLGGRNADLPLGTFMANHLTLSASRLRPQTSKTKAAIATHLRRHLWPALADPALLRPRIRRLALTDAATAHRAQAERSHYGKIVLVTEFGANSGNR